jgi:hypothetical protein
MRTDGPVIDRLADDEAARGLAQDWGYGRQEGISRVCSLTPEWTCELDFEVATALVHEELTSSSYPSGSWSM